ncbi:MAG: GIN domain-containing protein [Anaerolineae bacterium]
MMSKFKISLLVLFLPIFLQAFSKQEIVSASKKFVELEQIEISGPLEVLIMQADDNEIILEAPEKTLKEVILEEKGTSLSVSIKKAPSTFLWCKISVKDLHKMTLKRGACAKTTQLFSESFELDLKNHTQATISINCSQLNSRISGNALLQLEGLAQDQKVVMQGSGKYLAENLKSKRCFLKIRGSAEASVDAEELLHAKLDGSVKVSYQGNPQKIREEIHGPSKLFKKRLTHSHKLP